MPSSDQDFAGLAVGSFESRRAKEIARMIEKANGKPFVSPSMREIPVDDHRAAIEASQQIITGQLEIIIFMTGVGIRHFMSAIEKQIDVQRLLHTLKDSTTIARGPKPVAALREFGLTPKIRVPEPNTWRELLQTIDHEVPVDGQSVAVFEYGVPNRSLIAGLEARGARVFSVPIYRWDLPEDVEPLKANAERIAKGELDVTMWTSANQVRNLIKISESLGIRNEVVQGMRRCVVASIGPTTSEALRAHDIPVDLEPSHGKMGHLVQQTAARAHELLARKNQIVKLLTNRETPADQSEAPWFDSPFMRACRQEPNARTPVWLMRQAGRYMAEYRKVREKVGFLELCKNPALCSEVMCTAVKRLGVDAAIIFSDLLPILEPMGMDLEFAPGDGPVIHNPLREGTDIDRVIELENVDSLHFVMETVRQTRMDLPDDLPLIGFAGAPFTLASYMIEGGSSRNYLFTKTMMYRDEGAWQELMQRLARSIVRYLNAQIWSGAQCVQLFDSWAGCLSPADYRRFVKPYVQEVIAGLVPGVPVINFATGNPALLPELAVGNSTVVGVDWRIGLADAWQAIDFRHPVQGNLDPAALLAEPNQIRSLAKEVLQQTGGRAGHIFNLGHGILPQTPVDHAIALVDAVHEISEELHQRAK